MNLETLEKELNQAHKDYLKAWHSNYSKKEFQEIRDKYLKLADKYKEAYGKVLKSKNY